MSLPSDRTIQALHGALLAWYDRHRRDLPWRRTRDPYAIWVSEVMLQQTQVATVLPYYERWMARFPTVQSLAYADEQDALAAWQGLGYYRRARLLLEGARWVAQHGPPEDAESWRKVPGVGPYTAGAIASIAFGERAPVVDGNVERVFARLSGCDASGSALNRAAWIWARRVMHGSRPADWNQALMEHGATVCRPVNPLCQQCPVSTWCVALHTGQVQRLPLRKTPPETVRYRHIVWVPYAQGRFGVRQIPGGQWWEGMWEFPRAEDAEADGLEVPALRMLIGEGWPERLGLVRHQVTRHKVSVEAFLIRCTRPSKKLNWHSPQELDDLPLPVPQRRILKLAQAHLGLVP